MPVSGTLNPRLPESWPGMLSTTTTRRHAGAVATTRHRPTLCESDALAGLVRCFGAYSTELFATEAVLAIEQHAEMAEAQMLLFCISR